MSRREPVLICALLASLARLSWVYKVGAIMTAGDQPPILLGGLIAHKGSNFSTHCPVTRVIAPALFLWTAFIHAEIPILLTGLACIVLASVLWTCATDPVSSAIPE